MPALILHPASSAGPVRRIDAGAERHGATLSLRYAVHGDIRALRIADLAPTRPGRDLWQHTCFEAFVGAVDHTAYHELNLSPSGEWAVFAFRAYRDGGLLDGAAWAPRLTVQREPHCVVLDALLGLDQLSPDYVAAPLRVGLSAVIETADGTRSYWALRHPPGRPDFHHADAFALRLEPARGE